MDEKLEEYAKTPYNFFSLEADESTDSANKSVLIVYLRYVNFVGKVQTNYLGVQEMEATTADYIFAGVKAIMASFGLEVANMVGIATDGAAIMTGVIAESLLFSRKKVRELSPLIAWHIASSLQQRRQQRRFQLLLNTLPHSTPSPSL